LPDDAIRRTFSPDSLAEIPMSRHCFLEGTRIVTEDGPIAIEALFERLAGAGSTSVRVLTMIGNRPALQPVKDVQLCTVDQGDPVSQPVRVIRDAVAPGKPERDLVASPDQALHVDGALIPVRQLINSRSIREDASARGARFFRVMLENQALLIVEKCLAESDRGDADESGSPANLLALCTEAARIEAVRARLADRGGTLEPPAEMAQPAPGPTEAPAVRLLLADGRTLEPQPGRLADRVVFRLPPGAQPAALLSPATPPGEQLASGVPVRRLLVWSQHGLERNLDAAALPDLPGWHPVRGEERWSDVKAALDLPPASDAGAGLEIQFGVGLRSTVEPPAA